MKLAVFFPGIGYHCDKPLLYYSNQLAVQYQYEIVKVTYGVLHKELDKAFEDALAQTRKCLEHVVWEDYEEILFVSKSIGTAVACAYAREHGICCRNVYYTPLEQTFAFSPQKGIVFHGTEDPWADTEKIKKKCIESSLLLYLIEDGNHSLEIKQKRREREKNGHQPKMRENLQILTQVMEQTEQYLAEEIHYRELETEEIGLELFAQFIRHQKVTKCRRREKDKWVIREDPFIDDWTREDYQELAACLRNTICTGGFVYAAFVKDVLKGFVSVEPSVFGGENRYLDLSSIHVSEDMRGRRIGKTLFQAAAAWARKKGAGKLYISSHSAMETQAFYQAMGCVDAQEYEQKHVEREPYDCQLEYWL